MTLLSAQEFERAGLLAWPGIEVDWDGSWVRRAANGYTKRANSLQCLDPTDGDAAPERLAEARDWFTARGLLPVVRTTPLEAPALTAALDAGGWSTIDRSHLFAMALTGGDMDANARTFDLLDAEFLAAQKALQGHTDETMSRMRALFAAMRVPAAGVVVYRDSEPAAAGLSAVSSGMSLTGNVITSPRHRRQGLGAAMMRSLHAWAHANGATIAALNVQADNAAGQALYRSLGYSHQYDYCYRVPGDAA